MACDTDTMNGGFSTKLRAADAAARPVSHLAAGPFDVRRASYESGAMTLPDALITGLLIVYPAFATAVAVVVGLFLSGTGA